MAMCGPGVAAFRARERYAHVACDMLFPTTSTSFAEIEASSVLEHLHMLIAEVDLLGALRFPISGKGDRVSAGPAPQELILSATPTT